MPPRSSHLRTFTLFLDEEEPNETYDPLSDGWDEDDPLDDHNVDAVDEAPSAMTEVDESSWKLITSIETVQASLETSGGPRQRYTKSTRGTLMVNQKLSGGKIRLSLKQEDIHYLNKIIEPGIPDLGHDGFYWRATTPWPSKGLAGSKRSTNFSGSEEFFALMFEEALYHVLERSPSPISNRRRPPNVVSPTIGPLGTGP